MYSSIIGNAYHQSTRSNSKNILQINETSQSRFKTITRDQRSFSTERLLLLNSPISDKALPGRKETNIPNDIRRSLFDGKVTAQTCQSTFFNRYSKRKEKSHYKRQSNHRDRIGSKDSIREGSFNLHLEEESVTDCFEKST